MRMRDRIRSERRRQKKLDLQSRIQRARDLLAQAHGPTAKMRIVEALQKDPEAYHAILLEIPHIPNAWDSNGFPAGRPSRKWGYDGNKPNRQEYERR